MIRRQQGLFEIRQCASRKFFNEPRHCRFIAAVQLRRNQSGIVLPALSRIVRQFLLQPVPALIRLIPPAGVLRLCRARP